MGSAWCCCCASAAACSSVTTVPLVASHSWVAKKVFGVPCVTSPTPDKSSQSSDITIEMNHLLRSRLGWAQKAGQQPCTHWPNARKDEVDLVRFTRRAHLFERGRAASEHRSKPGGIDKTIQSRSIGGRSSRSIGSTSSI